MTVANQTNRTSAVGNAAIGQEVPFSFPYSATSDIKVRERVIATGVETLLAETTNYTLTAASDTGGTLTTVTAVAATSEIHIIRDTPKTQSLDLEAGGSFSAEDVEDALDKNTKLIIENKDSLDRALRAPVTDAVALDLELPNSVNRASKNLGFDAGGNATVTDSSGTFATQTAVWNDVIVKSPYFDIRAFLPSGYVTDGSVDYATELRAAIDAAKVSGGIVLAPRGTYWTTLPLIIDSPGVTFRGVGKPIYIGDVGTRIKYTGAGTALTISSHATRVSDIYFFGDDTGANGLEINSGAHQVQLRNVGLTNFTAVGLTVDYAVGGTLTGIDVADCATGAKIIKSFRVVYDDFIIVDNSGIGLHCNPDESGGIAYNKFTNFNFTGNGYESVNVEVGAALAIGLRNNIFDTFQMETAQADAGRVDGYFHWLINDVGWASKVGRNELRNIFFSSISNLWDGTNGNRCIKIQGGRWYCRDFNSEATAFTSRDVYVATANTLLNLGNITETELSRWSIASTVNIEGRINPTYSYTNLSVAGAGAWEDLVTLTIPKNTTAIGSAQTAGVYYPASGDDKPGGIGGLHVMVNGFRTTSGADTAGARITLDDTVLTGVAEANDDNNFIMEVWVYNANAAGVRSVIARNLDGTTAEIERSLPTIAINAAKDLVVEGKKSAAGDVLTISNVFIERF